MTDAPNLRWTRVAAGFSLRLPADTQPKGCGYLTGKSKVEKEKSPLPPLIKGGVRGISFKEKIDDL